MDTPAPASTSASLHDDLQFVRAAVERHDRRQYRFIAISMVWAAIIAVGYPLIDLAGHDVVSVRTLNLYWAIVPWVGVAISAVLGYLTRRSDGSHSRSDGARHGLHWGVFAIVFFMFIVIVNQHREVRGELLGQLCMLLTGIVYFLAGVHLDRRYLVPGLFAMVGSGAVGAIGPWSWTIVGLLMAGSLAGSALWMRSKVQPAAVSSHA